MRGLINVLRTHVHVRVFNHRLLYAGATYDLFCLRYSVRGDVRGDAKLPSKSTDIFLPWFLSA